MKKLYLLILCSSYLFSSHNPLHTSSIEISPEIFHEPIINSSRIVRELNYHNAQEINNVCDLFKNIDIRMRTCNTPASIHKHINNKTMDHTKFFICTTSHETATIYGILAYRHFLENHSAQYISIAVPKDYRRQGIASSLIAHAEQSMDNSIQTIVAPCQSNDKETIACYQTNGYRQSYDNKCDRCLSCYGFIDCLTENDEPKLATPFFMIKNIQTTMSR